MKRLIISILLMASIIVLSIINTFTLYEVKQELTSYLDSMSQKLEGGDSQVVVEDALYFQDLWMKEENRLVRFIRHADLEQITWDSARLPYLARYGDLSELTAEINRIRLQVEHLWDTQLPRLRTIL